MDIYTDGAARGNPGPAGIGVVMVECNKVIFSHGRRIGRKTNNQAEYRAVIEALTLAKEYAKGKIRLISDSQLVVNQLKGNYNIKSKRLKPLYSLVKSLEETYKKINYTHKKRNNKFIQKADKLANQALDDG